MSNTTLPTLAAPTPDEHTPGTAHDAGYDVTSGRPENLHQDARKDAPQDPRYDSGPDARFDAEWDTPRGAGDDGRVPRSPVRSTGGRIAGFAVGLAALAVAFFFVVAYAVMTLAMAAGRAISHWSRRARR